MSLSRCSPLRLSPSTDADRLIGSSAACPDLSGSAPEVLSRSYSTRSIRSLVIELCRIPACILHKANSCFLPALRKAISVRPREYPSHQTALSSDTLEAKVPVTPTGRFWSRKKVSRMARAEDSRDSLWARHDHECDRTCLRSVRHATRPLGVGLALWLLDNSRLRPVNVYPAGMGPRGSPGIDVSLKPEGWELTQQLRAAGIKRDADHPGRGRPGRGGRAGFGWVSRRPRPSWSRPAGRSG